VQEQLVIIPGSQCLPACGTLPVKPDTLRQAVGAEDMATGRGQEVVALPSDTRDRLQTDWALDTGEGGAGWRDSGIEGTVRDQAGD